MRYVPLVALVLLGCVEQPIDGTISDSCGTAPDAAALHPSIDAVADDTVTMNLSAWDAFHETAREIGDYMECRALVRCGELPEFPPDVQNPVEFRGKVTVTYRDWERRTVWVTLAEAWLECAE